MILTLRDIAVKVKLSVCECVTAAYPVCQVSMSKEGKHVLPSSQPCCQALTNVSIDEDPSASSATLVVKWLILCKNIKMVC